MIHADLSIFSLLDTKWTIYHKGRKHEVDSFEAGMILAEDMIRANRRHAINEYHAECMARLQSEPLPLFDCMCTLSVHMQLCDNELTTQITIS